VTVISYYIDKDQARSGGWRTSELHLHLLELMGGWPGALIAQHLFRHKNRKVSYQVVYWCIVLLHAAVLSRVVLPGIPEGFPNLAGWARAQQGVHKSYTPGRARSASSRDAKTITINPSDFWIGRKR
jgi:uncharacterized membrane protein YsdA (DUF1294 family)